MGHCHSDEVSSHNNSQQEMILKSDFVISCGVAIHPLVCGRATKISLQATRKQRFISRRRQSQLTRLLPQPKDLQLLLQLLALPIISPQVLPNLFTVKKKPPALATPFGASSLSNSSFDSSTNLSCSVFYTSYFFISRLRHRCSHALSSSHR